MKKSRNRKWFTLILLVLFLQSFLVVKDVQPVKAAIRKIQNVTIHTQVDKSTYNAISIKWNKTVYATGYAIYRKEAGSVKYTRLKVVNSNTCSYIDRNLPSSVKYYYAVRAYRRDGGRTYFSKYKPLLTATCPQKTSLKASVLPGNKVKLTWNAVKGAQYYRLYYKKTAAGKWGFLADVDGSKTTFESVFSFESKYYFCVKAYFKIGNKTYAAVNSNYPYVYVTAPEFVLPSYAIEIARKVIFSIESGDMKSVNYDYSKFTEAYADGKTPAISIGAGQWSGVQAQKLLKAIYAADPAAFKKIDSYGYVWKEVCNANWSKYRISAGSGRAIWIKRLISSPVGIQCQNRMMDQQIRTYFREISEYTAENIDTACMYIYVRYRSDAKTTYKIYQECLKDNYAPFSINTIFEVLYTMRGKGANEEVFRDEEAYKFAYYRICQLYKQEKNKY